MAGGVEAQPADLSLSLRLERTTQHFDVFGDLPVDGLELFDAAHTMHHCGVVTTTKATADLWQRAAGQLLAQVHRHLTGAVHKTADAWDR